MRRPALASLPPRGVEPADVSGDNTGRLHTSPDSGGAESGAESPNSGQFDVDLQRVIDAWPALPQAVKAGVLAMVQAAQDATEGPETAEGNGESPLPSDSPLLE